MDVCKTDINRIIRYLDDAAKLYDSIPGQRNICRAWMIRKLTKKLKIKSNDKKRHR